MSANEANETNSEKSSQNQVEEDLICEKCGKFGIHRFGERNLCADCAQAAGSCCSAEFLNEESE